MPDGRWVAHGTWLQRYEDGSVEVEWERAFGSDCGHWTAYFEDGAVHIRTSYYGDALHGPFIEYHYEDGSLSAVGYWVMGEPVGRHVSWTPAGQVDEDIVYPEGDELVVEGPQPGVDRGALAEQVEAALSSVRWAKERD